MDPKDAVHARLAKLFADPHLSDITLTTTSSDTTTTAEFSCHRALLFTVTPFFETALSPTSGFTESSTKTVKLDEHSPGAIKAFVEYCYTGKYTFDEPSATPALDFEVCQLADYLLANEAKEYATRMLGERLKELEAGGNATFLPGLVRAVYEAAVDGGVKHTVVSAVVKALARNRRRFLVPLLEVMRDYGEFSTAVLEGTVNEEGVGPQVVVSGTCCNCGRPTTVRWNLKGTNSGASGACSICTYGGLRDAVVRRC